MKRDDWRKPRAHSQHLTEEEIAQIKDAYIAGYRVEYIARKLACSSRNVQKYYGMFRAQGVMQNADQPPPKKPMPTRFYKSDFSL